MAKKTVTITAAEVNPLWVEIPSGSVLRIEQAVDNPGLTDKVVRIAENVLSQNPMITSVSLSPRDDLTIIVRVKEKP